MSTRRTYLLYLLPSAVASLILVVFPIAALLALSLMRWNPTERLVPNFVGLGNYVRMIRDVAFLASFARTIGFVIESVIVQMTLGLGIALLLNHNWPGMGIIRTLFLTPMMIAPLFAGMIWRLIYSNDFGILRYLLGLVGLKSPPLWLADPKWALHATVFVNTWQWTPFVVLFLIAGMQVIPEDVYEAASLDGASRWQTLRQITLPLLRRTFMAVVLFRTIDSFKVFDIIYAMTRGGPGSSTETLSYHLYQTAFNFYEIGYSSTLALGMFAVVMIMSWLLFRVLQRQSVEQ